MKKQVFLPIILSVLMLTACGASSDSSSAKAALNGAYAESYDSYDYDADYDDYSNEEFAEEEVGRNDSSANDADSVSANAIKREMLVYSCSMSVDTLDFQASLDSLKSSLEMYGGFIERENFNDGGNGGRWYSADEEKWQSYSATFRVPSNNYEDFCKAAADIGDMRSKTANVENLSTEYSDLSTTLAIYEAKEERYISMLADITDDEYAIAVEKELTEIQVKIAGIKTRMNAIETDVAYSYVYLTLNEVREYTQPAPTAYTFGDRLRETLRETGSGFLDFLEGLLFLIIHLAPYLVLIGIIAFVIVKTVRYRKGKKAARSAASQAVTVSAAADDISEPKDERTEPTDDK